MKKILFVCSLVFLVVSCDKRKDLYKENNLAANLKVELLNSHSSFSSTKINDLNYIDTLKMAHYYRFKVNITDENDYVDISFNGVGTMYMDGNIVNSTNTKVLVGEHLFEWVADTTGDRNFQLKFIDAYEIEQVLTFKINVFINRLPNVLWSIIDVGNISPLEKKIVVTAPDADAIYGGGINYYEYVINQDTTYYTGPVMYYVFPSAGSYLISVRARDNDNQWSNAYVVSNYVIN